MSRDEDWTYIDIKNGKLCHLILGDRYLIRQVLLPNFAVVPDCSITNSLVGIILIRIYYNNTIVTLGNKYCL